MEIREGLTFDDVLLQPRASNIMPAQARLVTRFTRDISINVPLISAAMDTVTEARLAIVMAQTGGIGVIHRNLTIQEQADEVRKVKRFESGMVVDPITIGANATRADVKAISERYNISGIPVVKDDGTLVGIVTNRDVRFSNDPNALVSDLMTKDVVTVSPGVSEDEARELLPRAVLGHDAVTDVRAIEAADHVALTATADEPTP